MDKTLSIVAPCYNEEEVLPEFLRRSIAAAEKLGLPYEIIVVDDGSSDRTWKLMKEAARGHLQVQAIKLLRNHGHQLALSAGLAHARGDYVVSIDADLQDPPELIGDMVQLATDEDADVVYGQRKMRAGETWLKVQSARLFYRFLNAVTAVSIPLDTGDFRLMRREIVDVLVSMPERHRFVRGMVSWIGGRQVPLLYDRDARFAGETKYTLRKMLAFSADAIISFSRGPLSIASYMGATMAVMSAAFALWAIITFFITETVAGWASLMTVIFLQFSLVFFFIGLLGEYVGRIFELGQNRPLYIVRQIEGDGLSKVGTRDDD